MIRFGLCSLLMERTISLSGAEKEIRTSIYLLSTCSKMGEILDERPILVNAVFKGQSSPSVALMGPIILLYGRIRGMGHCGYLWGKSQSNGGCLRRGSIEITSGNQFGWDRWRPALHGTGSLFSHLDGFPEAGQWIFMERG